MTRFFLAAIICFGCSKSTRNLNEPVLVDTLSYSKSDYDSMRKYFSEDSLFISRLVRKIASGDGNAIRTKMLLTTPFDLRHSFGLNDTEINAAILSFYTSKEVTDEFKELEKSLPRKNAALIRSETDSILRFMDKMKRDMGALGRDTTLSVEKSKE